jgi:hypothetical protein
MSGATYSGTGWNTNLVQILINEQQSGFTYQAGNVPADGWVRVSTGLGNGIYTGDTTDLTIDPLKLAGYNFIISREDFTSGSTYTLSDIFTGNTDFNGQSGLTFGDEVFFYGNVKCNIMSTTYKTLITATASNSTFNEKLLFLSSSLIHTNFVFF